MHITEEMLQQALLKWTAIGVFRLSYVFNYGSNFSLVEVKPRDHF
jgi:hypothetical protein